MALLKKKLGELLLEEGVISRDDLRELNALEKKTSQPQRQLVLRKGMVSEEQMLRALARQFGFPFENNLVFQSDEIFSRLPLELIQKSKIVPLKKEGNTLTLAVNDPTDVHPMDDAVAFFKGFRIKFVVAPETEIMKVIHANFDQSAAAAQDVMDDFHDEEYSDFDSLSEDTLDLANEAPIIRMVNALLTQGVQERASDIHIEPFEKHLDIRYRIDGILHRRMTPPRVIHAGIVSRIKIMANLNIAENRLPQDGRIKIKLAGKEIDIRVSTIPTRHGERVVMRLLNKTDVSFTMTTMGFSDDLLDSLRRVIAEPNGIILVTGPTGSGKSTTLYSFLSELNEESRNILTVEDPVEYEIDGIAQMQMQEKIGLTFANALRSFLRQDPDVIMVGEIRDEETARTAIQAALTGHLVLSTLHTNDAASAITRLMDMGIEPYLISSTVRAVLAQRLVRMICPSCKETYRPSPDEKLEFSFAEVELGNSKVYRGRGCDRCVQTGYFGRSGLFELMIVEPELQRVILEGGDAETLKTVALKKGMATLLEYGKRKIQEGVTTINEVMRVT